MLSTHFKTQAHFHVSISAVTDAIKTSPKFGICPRAYYSKLFQAKEEIWHEIVVCNKTISLGFFYGKWPKILGVC
jgi:uncharacterized ferritin-like protein (DUF455 family)